MRDRFLRDHCATTLVVDLGGRTHPISIRDQMTRGRLAVDRMQARHWIGPGRDLLVVGGGAAGATAAIHAAQTGIATWLIDREPELFSLQSACDSRRLCPTQYDWSAWHWDQGTLPPPLPAATGHVAGHVAGLWDQPLPFDTANADDLAATWLATVQAAEVKYADLKVYRNTELDGRLVLVNRPDGAFLQADFTDSDPGLGTVIPPSHAFGGVIYCRGHGRERCYVGKRWKRGQYRGYRFWDADPFGDVNYGLPDGVEPRVVISGGGDGALQDFLRMATRRPSARDVYHDLRIEPEWVAELHGFDDQAQLAYAFSQDAQNDHQVLDALHEQHARVAAELVARATSDPDARQEWERMFPEPPPVQLYFPCTHFGQCYGLNRFLVLAIDEYVRQAFPGHDPLLVDRSSARQVTSRHAGPCGDPDACHGQDHEVEFDDAPSCTSAAVPANPPRHADANIVILRHGLKFAARGRPRTPVRQALPYYLYA